MMQTDNSLDKSAPPMLKLLTLTQREADILDAANHIRFGELCDVDVEDGERIVNRQVSSAQAAFIAALRGADAAHLDVIVVHNGLPSQIEIKGSYQTIKYVRKIRFN